MSKLIDFLTGGIGTELVKGVSSFVKDRFPAKLSEADQAAISMKITELANAQIVKATELQMQEQAEFNQQIKDMEGTAADLKTIAVLGPMVLFLRGVQRPFWGFGTFYFDYRWFTGAGSSFTEQQQTALIVINMLVLGFLFGERAIKNLEPLIIKVFAKK